MNNNPIGIFDSGLGGLTVVKSMREYLPEEDIVYFGDTARVPYGNKSAPTIKRFSREVMDFLVKKRVKMIIAACNTASSLAIPALSKEYKVPVMGVIVPGVLDAASVTKNNRIGVIGTVSTITSKAYDKAMKKIKPEAKLFGKSCPLFVPLVENKFINGSVTRQVVDIYLKDLKKKRIDTLILGCTHYPLLKHVIGSTMKGVNLVDSARSVVRSAKKTLKENGLMREKGKRRSVIKCSVSDDPHGFKRTAGIFLRENISVKKVVL
jgi:glutamate racemase